MMLQQNTAHNGTSKRAPFFDRSRLPLPTEYYQNELPEHRAGRGRAMALCPFHDDHNPSLSINLETGAFRCWSCGARGGDVLAFHQLRYNIKFKDAAKDLGAWSNAPGWSMREPVSPRHEVRKIEPDEKALRISRWHWETAKAITKGDTAARYLSGRGLALNSYPTALRFHPNLAHHKDDESGEWVYYPALVARFDNPSGDLVTIQRIFLTREGEKAFGQESKRLSSTPFDGATNGGAIRLFEPTDVLGITEGIENALAFNLLYGIPTWSAYSAHGMKTVEIPHTVLKVVACVDHDDSGIEAAEALRERMLDEGRIVEVAIPPEPGTDWLDFYNQGGLSA